MDAPFSGCDLGGNYKICKFFAVYCHGMYDESFVNNTNTTDSRYGNV